MTEEEHERRIMKRIEMNDPIAMCRYGVEKYEQGDYGKAFEYFSKAAEFGDAEAHYRLTFMYHHGQGVEKDRRKKNYHAEEAAIGGHPIARCDLGIAEWKNGNYARAKKHWTIAAAQGHDGTIQTLKNWHEDGFVSKDDLASALRAHQAAVDATKSPQREAAEEEACKKREADLREELLFKQPEKTHLGDCPICCLPLPLDETKSGFHDCCGKVICDGCFYANRMRESEAGMEPSCVFCGEPYTLIPDEEDERRMMKRIELNDPVAMCRLGRNKLDEEDYSVAFEYFSKATELGDLDAHFRLACMYHHGKGVDIDVGKTIYHTREAAIGGHPGARYELGCAEWDDGNYDRAVKHWIIAATQGHDDAIKGLKDCHEDGIVSKDDLASALRAHQAAVDATKSPEREAGEQAACKKREADLREELLFQQPETSHLGDCPICFLPLPINDVSKSTLKDCCGKIICNGCVLGIFMREKEGNLTLPCPFCREPSNVTGEESRKRLMKRIEANDPIIWCQVGDELINKGEPDRAVEYWTKAAELGDAEAHYKLSIMYEGEGKKIHHLEEAAIGGHPSARHSLGCHEIKNGNVVRAVKHWIIAATQGDDDAIKALMTAFRHGVLKKEALAAALRAHHAAVDATKSPHREVADTIMPRRRAELQNLNS